MPFETPKHLNRSTQEDYADRTNELLASIAEKIQHTQLRIQELESRMTRPFSLLNRKGINEELDRERRRLHSLVDESRAIEGKKNGFIQ